MARRRKRGIIATSQLIETLRVMEAVAGGIAKGWGAIRQIEQHERDLDEREWRDRYPAERHTRGCPLFTHPTQRPPGHPTECTCTFGDRVRASGEASLARWRARYPIEDHP